MTRSTAAAPPIWPPLAALAYLLSKAIRNCRVVAFAGLGMEAIHEFELVDLPVTVAVDSMGRMIHRF